MEEEMWMHDLGSFAIRELPSRKIHKVMLISIRPHEQWSKDRYDKLCKIGFPVYGIRNVWSGKQLDLWVVPNNQLKTIIAYLYLCLIEEQSGE